jgi:hypothetical protein
MRDIWYLFNLGQFDPINQMIPLTVIPLSGAHPNAFVGDQMVIFQASSDKCLIVLSIVLHCKFIVVLLHMLNVSFD